MLQKQSTPLYHLIYSSIATERLNQTKLLELLKISRRNNEPRGLSGMLLYRDGLYLQFIEGHRQEVQKLLNRLKDDPRHENIRIIREGTLPQRLFPDWSMAYKNLMGLRSSQVAGYSERLQGQYSNETPGDPANLLIDMFQDMLTAA